MYNYSILCKMIYQALLYSDVARDNNIDNSPRSYQAIWNINQLCDFLTGIEKILGVNIIVNSGYRCPELNELVGGAINSYHQYGLAADIRIEDSPRCSMSEFKELMRILRHTRLQEVIVYDTYVHIAIKHYY